MCPVHDCQSTANRASRQRENVTVFRNYSGMSKLSERLKEARESAGLGRAEAAKKAGIAYSPRCGRGRLSGLDTR